MTLAANALQAAIFTRLSAQIPGTPVYDYVPPSTATPYILIGDDSAEASDTKTTDGQEFTVTIHVWDKAAGRKTVKTLLQNIHAALHHQESSLSPTDFNVVLIRFQLMDAFPEPGVQGDNDHYYHGVIRFRVIVRTN